MQPFVKTVGKITPLSIHIDYQPDPLCLLNTLRSPGGEHILLESAEVDSKTNLKSLLLVDASLRLTCRGNNVEIKALSAGGQHLLPWLQKKLPAGFTCQIKDSLLRIDCAAPASELSENERLRSPGNLTPLRLLQQLETTLSHPFAVFLAGVFGYDLIASFEDLPEVPEGHNNCPDYVFYLAETLLIIDHKAQRTELTASLISGPQVESRHQQLCQRLGQLSAQLQIPQPVARQPAGSPLDVHVTPDANTFATTIAQLKESIVAGDIFQVVPSRQFKVSCNSALAAYEQLKTDNPSPYMFYLQTAEFELFGASPESALKYHSGTNQVELYPIAGTRPRAKDENGEILHDLDSRIELDLRSDQKELAEHMMLVDLARNDLARIAVPGSRYVADLLKVDRYSHVMHLVSRVVAQLRPDLDALDAYRACMNMGTLTGAPKISASRLIRAVEKERRGSYGGAVGYLTGDGDMDTCIVIRSALVREGEAVVQAGAGVVYDSVPAAEITETENKARAVINAIITSQQQEYSI